MNWLGGAVMVALPVVLEALVGTGAAAALDDEAGGAAEDEALAAGADELAGGAAEEAGALELLPGNGIVTPAEAQNCWAKVSV